MKTLTFSYLDTEVRTVVENGRPWFALTDVAKALKYRDASDASRRLDDFEKGAHKMCTRGNTHELTTINESGLYHLMFKSRKSDAKRFRIWVTTEVLPEIFRTGSYSKNSNNSNHKDTRHSGQRDSNTVLMSARILRYDMAHSPQARSAMQHFDLLGIAAFNMHNSTRRWVYADAAHFAWTLRDSLAAEHHSR